MTARKKRSFLSAADGLLLLIIVAVLGTGVFFGIWRAGETDGFLREELLRDTRVLAETVNVADVRLLSGDETDLEKPRYRRFKEYFRSVLPAFPDARFITLAGRRYDGRVFFYVDSEPAGSKDESPPGEVYDAVDPAFLPSFDEKRAVVVGPVTDHWGTWISAWIPLSVHSSERVPAVLALDISGEKWRKQLLCSIICPALMALLIVVILLAGRFLLRRRASMDEDARWRLRFLEFFTALLLGLVLTAGAAYMLHDRELRAHRRAFSAIAEARSARMNATLCTMTGFVLDGTGRLFEIGEIEYGMFRSYASHLSQLQDVEAVLWSPRIPADGRGEFESAIRDEWRGALEIRERDESGRSVRAGERPVYFPVMFRSPMTGNEFQAGSDLFAEPEIRDVILEAETNRLPGSALVRMYRNGRPDTGVLLWRPHFAKLFGSPLAGGVSTLFSLQTLSNVVLSGGNEIGTIRISRLSPDSPPRILLTSGDDVTPGAELFRFVRPLSLPGITLMAEIFPGAGFLRLHPVRSWWVTLAVGIVLTAALSSFIGFSAGRREILERMVGRRTAELRRSEARHRMASQIYRSLSEGIVVTNPQGYILDGNAALEQLTGYTLDEIRGKRPGIFSAQKKHAHDSVRFWECLRANGAWQGEVWNRRKDGEAYPVWLTVNAVTDEKGEVTHYAGVLMHIGDIKSEQQRLSHLAYHDSLTGLPNRLLLADRLEMALARSRREKNSVVLFFMDLDGFKEINDRFGHETGDLLLVAVARRLVGAIREQDTVARFGGDEFVVVFDGIHDRNEAGALSRKVEELFSEPFPVGAHRVFCGVSIGTAIYPGDGEDAQKLIVHADMKMYEEKARRKEKEGETASNT